ncbi:unnamed protein product [Brugia pahangi]|uniref:Uncharacterized protein n=1 Tax=Brugia pahangi TaxID=6280 RepID=A0A0N4TSP2_BRUPA|nr:unnamed protein product [Brugia pahangi]
MKDELMVNSGRRKEKLEKKVGGRRADFNMERVEKKKVYEIFVMDSIDLQESNEIMRCAVLWCGVRCAMRCGVMRYGAVRCGIIRSGV